MDTIIIRKLLKSFKCFKGVYPLDMLPYKQKLPVNIIVNTDPSYKPGEHWVCICIDKNGVGRYFDSFGLPPLKREIFEYLQYKCIRGWDYNKVTLQSMTSTTCGHYCVLYIIFRCQGLTNEQFLSKFNSNTLENDKRMKQIFSKFSLAKVISK